VLRCFLLPGSEIIHLYLYLAVVWMSSVDTLCVVYTSPRQFPDLDVTIIRSKQQRIKIGMSNRVSGYGRTGWRYAMKNSSRSLRVVATAGVLLQ
jgi:hypothetical protein